VKQYLVKANTYCTPLPLPTVLRYFFEVFRVRRRFFFFVGVSDFGGVEVCEKKSVLDMEKGHYCTLLCYTPLLVPLYCLQQCAIYVPHDHDPLSPFLLQ